MSIITKQVVQVLEDVIIVYLQGRCRRKERRLALRKTLSSLSRIVEDVKQMMTIMFSNFDFSPFI
jgi:hypothetical protein